MPPSPKRRKTGAKLRVAFQGAPGAFSELAAIGAKTKLKQLIPDKSELEMVPEETFEACFAAVASGEVDKCIVPLENSVGGSIKRVLGLLLKHDSLQITAETAEVENPCLCGAKGAKLSGIKKVMSDGSHLDQCSHYLDQLCKDNGDVERCVMADSAGSCKALQESGEKSAAAIASKEAAKAYGLTVLTSEVGNLGGLATRYAFVSKKGSSKLPKGAQLKCSIAVMLHNQPMALMKLVAAFSLRNMNILKLESQPASRSAFSGHMDMFSGRHFDYLWFVDFEAPDGAAVETVLEHIAEFAKSVQMLGTYAKNISLEGESACMTTLPWTAYI